MLASRELATQLPAAAQTWVNENLEFYPWRWVGHELCIEDRRGGFPQYLIKNIPPESQYARLNISQPAIYYGEVTPGYKIVATGIKRV